MKRLLLLFSMCAWVAPGAWAQSSCASDGQATPLLLVERFISADCEACWRAVQTAQPAARALILDWIVPSGQGDEAPLSAATSPEAMVRLDTLARPAPATSFITRNRVTGDQAVKLRVAHGVPLGGYIGASIEVQTTGQSRLHDGASAWLVLVESIAAGADGTPSKRNLVRNVLVSMVTGTELRSNTVRNVFREMRPLSIPPGARPERLRVVGWLQDARGRVLSAAQSICAPPA